ncbi:hypothetical protein, partial [Escherichia coli]|uniref:hypothetical protein n=1 Tax=Escherichia coli TaxID=562 RepID=UPI0019535F35
FDELVEKHGYRGAAGEQTGVLIRSRSSNGKWELEQSQFGGVRVTVRESGRVVERTGDGALLAAAQDFEQARDLC